MRLLGRENDSVELDGQHSDEREVSSLGQIGDTLRRDSFRAVGLGLVKCSVGAFAKVYSERAQFFENSGRDDSRSARLPILDLPNVHVEIRSGLPIGEAADGLKGGEEVHSERRSGSEAHAVQNFPGAGIEVAASRSSFIQREIVTAPVMDGRTDLNGLTSGHDREMLGVRGLHLADGFEAGIVSENVHRGSPEPTPDRSGVSESHCKEFLAAVNNYLHFACGMFVRAS